jgi:hypothetical protein
MFWNASAAEKRGSTPRRTAASPQVAGRGLRQRRRHVHRHGGRANAALGTDEGIDFAFLGSRAGGLDAADRLSQFGLEYRMRQAFADAGAHGLENPGAIQAGQDHQEPDGGMLSSDGTQNLGQGPAAPVIDDQ